MKKSVIGLFILVYLIGMVSAWGVDITSPENGTFWNETNKISQNFYQFAWEYQGISEINVSDLGDYWINNILNLFGPLDKTTKKQNINRNDLKLGWNNLTIKFTNKSNSSDIKLNTSIFFLDDKAPILNLINPTTQYTQNSNLDIKAAVYETYIKNYEVGKELSIKVNGPEGYAGENQSNNTLYTYTMNKEGNYTYKIYAQDKFPDDLVNHISSIGGWMIRDITNPNVTINNPKDSSFNSGNILIDVLAQDRINTSLDIAGIENITLEITNSTPIFSILNYSENSETLIYNLDSTTLQDGDYNITANATDKAGNMNSTRINITIDNIAPIINITAPSNITYNAADGHRIILNYTLIEVNPEICWLDNGTNIFYESAGTNFTNLMSLESTQTTWKVYCNDSAGNQNSTEVSFYVDTILPELTTNTSLSASVFSPKNGDGILDELTISMNASELISEWETTRVYNSSGIQVKFFNSPIGSPDNIYNLSKDWDGILSNGSKAPDGIYTINTTITDKVSNLNTLYVGQVRVDNTAPKINFEIPTPTIGNYNSVQTINVSASDDRLSEIKLYVDNVEVANSSEGKIIYVLGEGNHTINATAYDEVGNKNVTETRNIFIDVNAPQISYVAPTKWDGNNVSQNWILVNVSILEGNEDMINFSLYNDSGLVDLTSRTYTSGLENINWTGLADGVYYYNVSLNDSVGNSNKTSTWKITLDTSIPQIDNVSSSKTYNSATITWDTNETSSSIVYYGTDVSTLNTETDSDETTSHSISLTGLSASTIYYYNVSSCDFAGNCNTSVKYNFTTSATPSNKNNNNGGGGGGSSSNDYYRCLEWGAWSECVNGTKTQECINEESVDSPTKQGPLEKTMDCSIGTITTSSSSDEKENKTEVTTEEEEGTGFFATMTGNVIGFAKSKTGRTTLVILGSLALLFLGAEFYRRLDLSKKK